MVATAAVLSSTASAPGSVVAEGCATTDHGAYTAMLCLHVAGGPLSGEAPVSVTFSSSDARTLVRELEVELDGQHLVSDYEDPFEFQLPSYLFGDGNHTLSATALLRDGSRTQPVSFTVAFGNGGQQPAATSFVPTSGTAPIAGRPFIVAAAGNRTSSSTLATSTRTGREPSTSTGTRRRSTSAVSGRSRSRRWETMSTRNASLPAISGIGAARRISTASTRAAGTSSHSTPPASTTSSSRARRSTSG